MSGEARGCATVRPPLPLSDADAERFTAKVDKRGDDKCWLWTGRRGPNGYGRVWLRDARRLALAHRVAAQLAHGAPTAPCVLHSCDNSACCNPAHLRYGTQAENIEDRDSRGHGPVGDRHGRSQLTAAAVRTMRDAYAAGATTRELGRRFGVTQQTARYAVTGRTWRHLA